MGKIGVHSSNFIDMTGWKMYEHGVPDSKIEVIKQAPKDPSKPKKVFWICKCSCGNPKEFIVDGTGLRSGNTLSCGCVKLERHPYTHKETGSKLYQVWAAMRKRCRNPHDKNYDRYGGRGIKVCDEWNHDYVAFRDWAYANGYEQGLEIDRINNDGNYEPSNCKWSTHKEQCNNRNSNVWIEYNGERKQVSEWCETLDIPYTAMCARVLNGWTAEEILNTPYKTRRTNIN